MNFDNLIGQTIDGKYRIERQLGKGGMGTVYLATHIGTERPVAVKVIAPQFMERTEFVERFRREARAAGRLRHPNVVNVTDFGYCREEGVCKDVVYLVMEYLDGCTLGEILEEEKKLPLMWSLDILEQVCSAVHAAHEQGVIHRDLKPDNIWLEPNQRGGYTVKVLDFGIAKLEARDGEAALSDGEIHISSLPTSAFHNAETVADKTQATTLTEANGNSTVLSDKGTALMTGGTKPPAPGVNEFSEKGTAILAANEIDLEGGTAILPDNRTNLIQKDDGTRMLSPPAETDKMGNMPATADLTRVGAVLGTPLYMSPEQCRGERLTARSDIYSLGVIAYQMLGGKTPFEGEFTSVMRAHRETPPPPLTTKNIPRKVKNVIHRALSKNAADRPPTAEALASQLRAQSEGIGELLRRSMVIYSEHLPKFLGLTTFFLLPVIFFTISMIALRFLQISGFIDNRWGQYLIAADSFFLTIIAPFCASLTVGATTWIVAQHLAVPLRPVRVRPALRAVSKRWKSFAWTGTLKILISLATCGLGFVFGEFLWSLSASVVMMEKTSGWQALKRSTALARRSFMTTVAAISLMFIVPAVISGAIYYVVFVSIKAFDKQANTPPVAGQTAAANDGRDESRFKVRLGGGQEINLNEQGNEQGKDMRARVIETVSGSLIQIFWLPMQLFVASFISIILALLYLKTRQAGGEPIRDLLEQFEDAEDRPRMKWQQRVEDRLVQSGRITTGKT